MSEEEGIVKLKFADDEPTSSATVLTELRCTAADYHGIHRRGDGTYTILLGDTMIVVPHEVVEELCDDTHRALNERDVVDNYVFDEENRYD